MTWSIISHIVSLLIGAVGGWTLHCHFYSNKKEHIGNNTASNGGVMATNGSTLANVENVVNNYNMLPVSSTQIQLSEQAKRILVEFLNSKQSLLIYLRLSTDQREIRQLNIVGKCFKIDAETIDGDINDLVEAEYLRLESSDKSTKRYELTHIGREYAKELSKSPV